MAGKPLAYAVQQCAVCTPWRPAVGAGFDRDAERITPAEACSNAAGATTQITDLRSPWEVDSVLRDIMTGLADCSAPARRLRYRCCFPAVLSHHTALIKLEQNRVQLSGSSSVTLLKVSARIW